MFDLLHVLGLAIFYCLKKGQEELSLPEKFIGKAPKDVSQYSHYSRLIGLMYQSIPSITIPRLFKVSKTAKSQLNRQMFCSNLAGGGG